MSIRSAAPLSMTPRTAARLRTFISWRDRSVPGSLLALLKSKCPSYYLDQEEGDERPYLMNHCRCGAKLDDDYVQGDIGAAFWPDTPEGYGDFKLFLLPIDEPIPVESSWMLGGGEYLDVDNAKPWTEL